MASPIEDLHAFDLHIYVGSRSWPDDVELYCEVTYPGLDAEHPIEVNYMHLLSQDSLDDAIQLAIADIGAYMHDPHIWIREHIKRQGTTWEKRRTLELEKAYHQRRIADCEDSITSEKERLASVEEQLRQVEEKK